MGSSDNRLRKKWQDYSGKNAGVAEKDFFETFKILFEGTEFRIRPQPNEFSKIYVDYPLSEKELSEIYTPEKHIARHGVFPDYAIDNLETNKTIYIEVKRQDGWVEGGKRSDGRGNAHERSCKFFTPGLQKILRKEGNLGDDILPFWTVFQGDITRDPCRVREITCWYDDLDAHFFFWRDSKNQAPLIEHFLKNIKPLLM
ncbi:MAG: MunI family type II restriction endonuclease [Candidatus Roizmanbacteria bacterium]|nr:MunI family type II restriction endonuclease [Candidatus Roizmanbacteria bacterium]